MSFPGGHEPLLSFLDAPERRLRLREPLDDEVLHAFGWCVHEMFAHNPAPEAAELLLSLYEQGPCAQCREKFVADLIALDALPTHLAQECRFDANEGVRALVAPFGGTPNL